MFKIGEFSRIAQTPVSQLRYYGDIGLFEPAEIDPFTGYRYYSAHQLPLLNRILVLKGLGLQLEHIRQAISDDISAETMRDMLHRQKKAIERSLEDERARLRAVEARLQQIDDAGPEPGPEVVLKSVPAQSFLGLRTTFPLMSEIRPIVEEMLAVVPGRLGPRVGHLTAVLHDAAFDFENVDVEFGFALTAGVPDLDAMRLPSGRILEPRELPAAPTMATAAQVTTLEGKCLSYAEIGRWIEDHGYTFAGAGREVFLQPPAPGTCDLVVELQFPIVEKEAAVSS
ncbi:MAG: MerR family transcriptional regulator [Acidobacteriota bacterium]